MSHCLTQDTLVAFVEGYLRESEAERLHFHIDECPDCLELVATLAEQSVGQKCGNYRIIRKLGAGGMGVVYEARHENIARRSAIKILHAYVSARPEFARRFVHEARVSNIVQHEALVQVFELDHLPDGTPYLVMEYLEGETLAAVLRRRRMSLAEALDVTRQVGQGLLAAHDKGIVHRDIKPSNIMLVPHSQSRVLAKILDFGIARLVAEHCDGETQHTDTAAMLGTAEYMSPEQCRGAGGVDEQTDVYALGMILYEMLAGRLPFSATGRGEWIAMHLRQTPPPLSRLAPATPRALCNLVHRMLAKDPLLRPRMAQILASLSGSSVMSNPSGRKVMLMGSLAATLLALIASGVDRRVGPAPQRGTAMLRVNTAPLPETDSTSVNQADPAKDALRSAPSLPMASPSVPAQASLLAKSLTAANRAQPLPSPSSNGPVHTFRGRLSAAKHELRIGKLATESAPTDAVKAIGPQAIEASPATASPASMRPEPRTETTEERLLREHYSPAINIP